MKAQEEAAAARAECSNVRDRLKEKKKEATEFEQRAKSTKAEVAFLKK